VAERHGLRQAEQLGQLAERNDHRHARQVSAHHLVGNEFDQAAGAHYTIENLKERGEQRGEGEQHRNALDRELAAGGELGSERRHDRRRGRARRGNEATVAADQRRYDAQRGRTENSGKRALARVVRADGGIHQHAERDRRRQRDQHRRQAAPQVAGEIAVACLRRARHVTASRPVATTVTVITEIQVLLAPRGQAIGWKNPIRKSAPAENYRKGDKPKQQAVDEHQNGNVFPYMPEVPL